MALLKKRICVYFVGKFKGTDAQGTSYAPGFSPAAVMGTLFNAVSSFRDSGLQKTGWASMSWMGLLPSWQVEAISFLNKLLAGHQPLDRILEGKLQEDAHVPAETVLLSDAMLQSPYLDLASLLQAKKDEEVTHSQASAAEAQATEQTTARAVESASEPVLEPAPEAEILAVPAELQDETMPDAAKPSLDRLACFPVLHVPETIVSVLEKHSGDHFVQCLEWADVRIKSFLDIQIKAAKPGLRDQLAGLKHGPTLYIYDVKCRVRKASEGILLQPFKRPVPADHHAWKRILQALWAEPSTS